MKSKSISVVGRIGIASLTLAYVVSCGPITEHQKADALADQYEKIDRASEQCRFAPQVVEAYTRAGDGGKVQEWQHKEKIACLNNNIAHSVGDYSD